MLVDMKWYRQHFFKEDTADLWGLWAVINDLYENHPELFGSEKVRAALKKDVTEYLGQYHDKHRISDPELYMFFVERLDHYQIKPFENISCAFVSPSWDFVKNANPLLQCFGTFHIVSRVQTNECTYKEVHDEQTQQCATKNMPRHDYVLTGNVINDPDSVVTQIDTILACGMLAKKEGKLFHILNYGEEELTGNIDNASLHHVAGQTLIRCDPPGEYIHDRGFTNMMEMKQQQELVHTSHSEHLYRDYARASHYNLLDKRIQTSDGKTSFTLQEYFDHFLKKPEALQELSNDLKYRGGVSHIAGEENYAKLDWQPLSNAMFGVDFYPENATYTYETCGKVLRINNQKPSIELREEIKTAFCDWWDKKVEAIATELKRMPEKTITEQRFYSTGPVADSPAKDIEMQ